MGREIADLAKPLEEMPLRPNGYVGTFATSPAAPGEVAEVTITSFGVGSSRPRWTVRSWAPRVDAAGEAVLPSRGDPCLVAIDDVGEAWVLGWEPA